MKLLKFSSLMASVILLSSCVIAVNTDEWEDRDGWYSKQKNNAQKIEQLELGKSEASIRSDLGAPDFNESFLRGEESYVVLYYRTRHIDGDGVTSKDETTPLVFVQGSLVGWGDSAIENASK